MASLAHYRVYVEHPRGVDKMIVTLKGKRSVDVAGYEGRARCIRHRMTGDVALLDVVPMRYVKGELIETRRMRVQKGKFVNQRKARARASTRIHKRPVL
jgi:hypothetical protein